MNRHPLSFTNLVDWVDGRLDEGAQRQVEAHLAAGCPTCEQDLAWLRRVVEAAQSDDTVEPPRELVAQAKSLYRSEALRPRAAAQRAPLFGLLRPAWAAALLLLLAVAVTALTQVPTLSRRHAVLTAKEGSVARRGAGDVRWQDLTPSERLGEGDQLRVLDGTAVLALFDGSTLHLEPGTLLTLSSLRSGLFGGSRRISVSQQAGSVDYEVAPLLGLISSFEAQAPSVRVTVRGTRFVLTVESEKETRVAVLQGSVRLVNALESTVLAEREVALVWPDAPPVRLPTLLPTATLGREAIEAPTWTAVLAAPEPTATAEPYPVPQPTMTVGQPAVTATLGATTTVTGAATPVPSVTVATDVLEFQAPIERFPPQWVGVWRIGGRNVLVTRDTNIVGQPAAGLLANVTAVMQGPSAALEPLLRALRIEIESPPEWTPTPSSTVTLRPSRTPRPTHTERPTRTITPTRTPRETPGQEPTKTPKPTHTPRPTHTPKPSPTPRPTETLRPTLTPEPSHTPRATLTPKPSHTPRPTLTLKPSPTPRPTRTPTLTRTPRPTPTPRATDTPEAAETPQPTETPEPSETPTETLIEVGIPTATATP